MVICWHQKQLRQRCVWTPNESSGMLEKRYVQAFKIIGTGNLLSLVCNFSSFSFLFFFCFCFLRSLAEEAIFSDLPQWGNLFASIERFFLVFSSIAITSPNTFLTNNFSFSHIFRLFSQPRHCILYTVIWHQITETQELGSGPFKV